MNGNAERQRAYKARMKEQGLVQVNEWIPEDKRQTMKRFAERLRRQSSSPSSPAPSA